MSSQIFRIKVRKKEYDVEVKDSSNPMTTIKFQYNNTYLVKQVYLADDISEEDRYRILQESMKDMIYKYNKRCDFRKLQKQKMLGKA